MLLLIFRKTVTLSAGLRRTNLDLTSEWISALRFSPLESSLFCYISLNRKLSHHILTSMIVVESGEKTWYPFGYSLQRYSTKRQFVHYLSSGISVQTRPRSAHHG